jgi:hypothetical protein
VRAPLGARRNEDRLLNLSRIRWLVNRPRTSFLCCGSWRENAGMIFPRRNLPCCSFLVSNWNFTTRGRHFRHGGANILCFRVGFHLTEFPPLITLRAQIRGKRDWTSGRPTHPGNTATSSHATGRTSSRHRGGCLLLPVAGAPRAVGAA